MSDRRKSMAPRPSIPSPSRRTAATAAGAARVATRIEILRDHLRRVSEQAGSPVEPPPRPGIAETLETLEVFGVEPIHFFAELLQLWRADPRLRSTAGGEKEEM